MYIKLYSFCRVFTLNYGSTGCLYNLTWCLQLFTNPITLYFSSLCFGCLPNFKMTRGGQPKNDIVYLFSCVLCFLTQTLRQVKFSYNHQNYYTPHYKPWLLNAEELRIKWLIVLHTIVRLIITAEYYSTNLTSCTESFNKIFFRYTTPFAEF